MVAAVATVAAVSIAYAVWSILFKPVPVLLSGSGATFPMEQIQAWAIQVNKVHPWLTVEYAGGGSGKGQSDFLQGIVDFAASDPPLKSSDWEKARGSYGGVYQLPIVLGAVAVVYNIPELPQGYNLRLTGEVLVDILLGKIERWDDPRIAELNQGVKLPSARITFIHRSDSSGTTEVFTSYLSFVSEEWRNKVGVGKTVKWPLAEVGRASGAPGNPGVAALVRETPYSIGYVELAFAKGLGIAMLRNNAGRFVLPTPETIAAAAAGAVAEFDPESDVSKLGILQKILASRDPNAYPIASPSYLLVKHPKAYTPEKRTGIATFLEYVFTDGQKLENIVEGYIPVPEQWREIGRRVARTIRNYRD